MTRMAADYQRRAAEGELRLTPQCVPELSVERGHRRAGVPPALADRSNIETGLVDGTPPAWPGKAKRPGGPRAAEKLGMYR
jgi:hypothetical protein